LFENVVPLVELVIVVVLAVEVGEDETLWKSKENSSPCWISVPALKKAWPVT
jgi:hypothetical protein